MDDQNSQTSPKGPEALPPSLDNFRRTLVAVWMNNPLGDVALDAAAVTLLSVLCLLNPEINDPKNWAEQPPRSIPSIDPAQWRVRTRVLMTGFRVDYMTDATYLSGTADALATALKRTIGVMRPVLGSMKLHFVPEPRGLSASPDYLTLTLYASFLTKGE